MKVARHLRDSGLFGCSVETEALDSKRDAIPGQAEKSRETPEVNTGVLPGHGFGRHNGPKAP